MIGIETDDANGNIFNNNLLGQDNPQAWPQTLQAADSAGGADIPPVSMGGFAQANALAKGGYFDHGGKLFHRREGKVFQVTGAPEGDYELNAWETATVNAQRGHGQENGGEGVATPGTGSVFTPRPASTPRKQTPDLWKGEENDRANPLNPPYDPESVAVRGRGGQPLSDELKLRVGERLKGTNFENMDLDSLKLYRGKARGTCPVTKRG